MYPPGATRARRLSGMTPIGPGSSTFRLPCQMSKCRVDLDGRPPRPPQIRTCSIPASGSSGGRIRYATSHPVMHHRNGQRVAAQDELKPLPRERRLLAAAIQPPPPDPCHLRPQAPQRPQIARDSIIGVMAPELADQLRVLPAPRLVSVRATPLSLSGMARTLPDCQMNF